MFFAFSTSLPRAKSSPTTIPQYWQDNIDNVFVQPSCFFFLSKNLPTPKMRNTSADLQPLGLRLRRKRKFIHWQLWTDTRLSRWYWNDIKYQDNIERISRLYWKDIKMILKGYQDNIKRISKWYRKDIKMILQWYQNDIKRISWLY